MVVLSHGKDDPAFSKKMEQWVQDDLVKERQLPMGEVMPHPRRGMNTE